MNPFNSSFGRACLRGLHRSPFLYGVAKRIFSARGLLPPRAVHGIPGRVHRNDFMVSDPRHYAKTSKEHFETLSEELAFADREWSKIKSFIDFGCGYGRVTRWLPTVIPADRVTAFDVNPKAVRWCEREFGVRGLVGRPEIAGTPFGKYDALFACSVLTHLSERMVDVFLQNLPKILHPGGVAVFTGKALNSAKMARETSVHLVSEVVEDSLERDGFYFQAYPHYRIPDLGDTFFTPEWLAARLPQGLNLVRHRTGKFWTHDSYVVRLED
jgi:SAM-dependent methyltransferase